MNKKAMNQHKQMAEGCCPPVKKACGGPMKKKCGGPAKKKK